jgi:hypothetical protein
MYMTFNAIWNERRKDKLCACDHHTSSSCSGFGVTKSWASERNIKSRLAFITNHFKAALMSCKKFYYRTILFNFRERKVSISNNKNSSSNKYTSHRANEVNVRKWATAANDNEESDVPDLLHSKKFKFILWTYFFKHTPKLKIMRVEMAVSCTYIIARRDLENEIFSFLLVPLKNSFALLLIYKNAWACVLNVLRNLISRLATRPSRRSPVPA